MLIRSLRDKTEENLKEYKVFKGIRRLNFEYKATRSKKGVFLKGPGEVRLCVWA